VDRAARIGRLPLALAVALRLHEEGAEDALIASALAIEPEGVGPVLEVARAKLNRIEATEPREEGLSGHG
jgi:hypothetical protein